MSPGNRGNDISLLMSLTNLGIALSQGIGGSVYEAMDERWGTHRLFRCWSQWGHCSLQGCWLLMPLLNQLTLSSRKAEREAY